MSFVRAADPERVMEVLQELEFKGPEVRNPSAFVCKALSQFRTPRRRLGRGGLSDVYA
ncbi:unnamed protein product [Effrenium voratum]|nr:unnamed protein product [Effrenium voratum]